MKKLILLSIILIVGCEESPSPIEASDVINGVTSVEDCAGVPNGSAYIDLNCGSGASCVGGDSGSTACIQDCAGQWGGDAVEDCSGTCGGILTDANSDGFCDEWVDLTVTDVDGNSYETVQIGAQLWMQENLKVTRYNDGSEIPYPSNEDWGSNDGGQYFDEGQYGVYDNDPSNADIYGNLYNWYAVDDDRGVCPDGWHVPSDAEYTILTDYLGGTVGGKMKEAGLDHWKYYSDEMIEEATNESVFTGLPAGARIGSYGLYSGMGNGGYFWSSSEDDSSHAWYRKLYSSFSFVSSFSSHKQFGYSIRCLAD